MQFGENPESGCNLGENQNLVANLGKNQTLPIWVNAIAQREKGRQELLLSGFGEREERMEALVDREGGRDEGEGEGEVPVFGERSPLHRCLKVADGQEKRK